MFICSLRTNDADPRRWISMRQLREMKVQKIEPQETHKQSHTAREWKHRSWSENRDPNDVYQASAVSSSAELMRVLASWIRNVSNLYQCSVCSKYYYYRFFRIGFDCIIFPYRIERVPILYRLFNSHIELMQIERLCEFTLLDTILYIYDN